MKKKKIVALITLHHVKNYGSVLQTLATQKLFEKLGYKIESTTDYTDFHRSIINPVGM